jgi:hypothetical protein
MPIALRKAGKATEIAERLLGIPKKKVKTKKPRKKEAILEFEETRRV